MKFNNKTLRDAVAEWLEDEKILVISLMIVFQMKIALLN